MKKIFRILIIGLLLCGGSNSIGRDDGMYAGSNPVSLRRIKDISWNFNTRIGKVILTSERFETHIQARHPFVTIAAIRKTLEHPAVKYKSRKRWCFEKDGLRVVIGKDNKVVTAYYITK